MFHNCCLMYNIFNCLAQPSLNEFVSQRDLNIRKTQASSRGDCEVKYRGTNFGRSAFIVRAAISWNRLPINIIYNVLLLHNLS